MKPTKLVYTLLFACLLTLSSCEKDDGNSGNNGPQENIPDTFSEYFGNDISRDFLGTVIDKNHNPIEGVTISIGNETAMTDSNGVFIIRDADVKERFGYIKAEKAGYLHGSRSVVPSPGTNKIQIMLLEETVVGTVSSGNSETLTADDGSSVSFDGNFIKEDGSVYTGSVDVIMHHLDPTDDDMALQMPGMLYAENEEGAERMLQTLGMLAVELRGSGGEDLNLAEGAISEIKIPVDTSLLSTAPTTIPLWYFDETTGYWKEEGQATLQGNFYVGTVSHFSFWNCDIPAEAITLCVTVVGESDNPLNNIEILITSTNYGTRRGVTNEFGQVCGLVPSNESLELNIYYPECSSFAVISEIVGPFSMDDNISITVPDSFYTISETVTGTFNTCDSDTVTDGYIQLIYADQVYTDIVTDGAFEFDVLRCSNNDSFMIVGRDFLNSQSSGVMNYTFSTPFTNLGTISACTYVNEFIEYSIDNGEVNFITEDISVVVQGDFLNIQTPDNCFNVIGYIPEPNISGIYDTYIITGELPVNTGFVIVMSDECSPGGITNAGQDVVFTLNSWGEVGEYIHVNFNGTARDLDFNFYEISGIIHVIRDE